MLNPGSFRHVLNAHLAHSGFLKRSIYVTAIALKSRGERIKSFDEMPEKKHITGILGAGLQHWWNRYKLHEIWRKDMLKYGQVYKEHVGPVTQIHIGGADAIEDTFRQMGKQPLKPGFVTYPWKMYREQSGESFGILTVDGEPWYKFRHALADKILKREIIFNFDKGVNEIITDFISRLRTIRDSDMTVHNATNEFYRWAMETICHVIYEKRLGILNDPMPQQTQEFINAVGEMLETSIEMAVMPELHAHWNTRLWQRHTAAWTTIFKVGRFYIDMRLNELAKCHEEAGGLDNLDAGPFLTRLIESKQLSSTEIYANVSEIMLAGVDTTSNTMCFTLCLLAKNLHVQKKLQEEVDTVLDGRIATGSDLSKLPYLKMVVKESMRLCSVVPIHVRLIARDVVIGGYKVPANTPLLLHTSSASTDPNIFDDPEVFRPERWDRGSDNRPHPFSSLPFGFGTRVCLGRRLAELELHLILTRIAQQFDILPTTRYKLKPNFRAIVTPGENLPLRFQDRK